LKTKLLPLLACLAAVGGVFPARAGEWTIRDESPAQSPSATFLHESKRVTGPSVDGRVRERRIDLVWFDGSTHTFRIIDNGPSNASPKFASLAAAVMENGFSLGCNGGFFHPDHSPSGLMIAAGVPTGRFGQGSLLSGVVLSSGRGNPYLLRRGEYDPAKYRSTDLLQSGPFLVDQGRTVKGLSPENSRRRTFVLHDGGHRFALGASDPFTLAELGTILALPEFSPSRKIHRALNLDGGSSSGLYYAPEGGGAGLRLEPVKTVRNFIAIAPKSPPR